MTEVTFDPSEKWQSQVPAVQLLVAIGYTPLSRAKALELRGGRRRTPILDDVLAERIIALNPIRRRGQEYPLDLDDAQEAIRRLTPQAPLNTGMATLNRGVYDDLVRGRSIPTTIDGTTISPQVRYIDWTNPSNNVYHVTVEYDVERTGSTEANRLDVVAFVNGIPFVTIECKRPAEPVANGDHKLLRYQRPSEIPGYFSFAQLLLALNRREAHYATVGTPKEFWTTWREHLDPGDAVAEVVRRPLAAEVVTDLFGGSTDQLATLTDRVPSEQDRLLHALCRPERLLEFVRTFTVFDGGVRKVARHQQFAAVKRTIERVTSGAPGQSRPGGVIWHTQGSGKSLTMVMLGKALAFDPRIDDPRLVLVTDRDDLDVQIRDTFRACELEPVRARSGKHLAELILARTPLITTIVNKFGNAAARLEGSADADPNVFVLVDESHRSHSAALGEYGVFARMMRRVLPAACYIGFTGTPLLKREKNTMRTFGPLIDAYTMKDANDDQVVVPLLYEGRHVEKHLAADAVDAWFDRISEGLTPEQRAELKRKFSRPDRLAGASQVIRAKAFDVSEHYRQHWQDTGLKGQLVAPDKASAIRFHHVLDEIGHVTSAVVISPPGDDEVIEAADHESRELVRQFWDDTMRQHGSERAYVRHVVDAFKGPGGPEILIVVSKLLTGFDAPRNTVLYVCRTLREHTLLQAIARVNRLYEPDDGEAAKTSGIIIDYEGLLQELDHALTTYSSLDGFDQEDLLGAVVSVREEIRRLPARWDAVWSVFNGVSHSDQEAMERHLEPLDTREEFSERLTAFTRTLHIALSSADVEDLIPHERLERYKHDWAGFIQLRRSMQYRYNERVDLRDYEPKVQRLLDDHVGAMPTQVVIEALDLTDPKAVHDAASDHGRNHAARADRIASATRRRITERMDEDPALYRRFSALLEETIEAHRAHRISEVEYLARMRDHADDVVHARRDEMLPPRVSHDEPAAAVYAEILGRFPMSDEALRVDVNYVADVAVELIDLARHHLIVDFWENTEAQNDLANAIDSYLWDEVEDRHGVTLTPDDEEAIRTTVLRIAKARFP